MATHVVAFGQFWAPFGQKVFLVWGFGHFWVNDPRRRVLTYFWPKTGRYFTLFIFLFFRFKFFAFFQF